VVAEGHEHNEPGVTRDPRIDLLFAETRADIAGGVLDQLHMQSRSGRSDASARSLLTRQTEDIPTASDGIVSFEGFDSPMRSSAVAVERPRPLALMSLLSCTASVAHRLWSVVPPGTPP
jgi:hypothetical protein